MRSRVVLRTAARYVARARNVRTPWRSMSSEAPTEAPSDTQRVEIYVLFCDGSQQFCCVP